MIQKLLALLLSLILALTGAVPSSLLPSDEGVADEGELSVATTPSAQGEATELTVAWTKVDGETVEDARWGQGTIDRIAFKVGVRASSDASLGVADEAIELTPTDVIVLEGFEGRFEFKDVGTTGETILLDGKVSRTSVSDKDASRVTTEAAPDAGGASEDPGEDPDGTQPGEVQRVVINNEPVDGVSIERGSAQRLATQGADEPETVNVLAAWVTVDGERIDHYLSGDGPLENVTFMVGPYADGHEPRLNVSGDAVTLTPGAKVRVEGFQGSYLVYQVDDGRNRIRLDGAAETVKTPRSTTPTGAVDGEKPVARFTYAPADPITSDTITFQDRSYDPDSGRTLIYQWEFGDGTQSVEQNPRHSYDEPGTYMVRLEVTDDDLRTNVTTAVLDVGNTRPQVDFTWHPDEPDDVDPTRFVSEASDPDGEIVRYEWDFGDGTTATGPRPEHTFPDDGVYEVTHTVTDSAGDETNLTRVVNVRNVAPDVNFTHDPQEPVALESVEFTSRSDDPDGSIESYDWDFGDGATADGANPVHHFAESGTYEVSLTATDDDGATATHTREVEVHNRPPEVSFDVLTNDPVTGESIDFSEDAVDRDGHVQQYEWSFGDGTTSSAPNPSHAYDVAATYEVTLTVTDDEGGTNSTTETLTVANAPPLVDFVWDPQEPFDESEVAFTDLTTDADGEDDLVSWFWDFDDGNTSSDRHPTNVFPDNGTYNVSLTVEDDAGHVVTESKEVLVRNQPPEIDRVDVDPDQPNSRDNITFLMEAHDPDGTIASYEWEFPNGTVLDGRVVNASLPEGTHDVTARAIDDDGAPGVQIETVQVDPAPPIANFSVDPENPPAGQIADFSDESQPGDAPITEWRWKFGDGEGSVERNPNHTYAEPGTYEVYFRAEDTNGNTDWIRRDVTVTAPPQVDFTQEPTNPFAGQTVYFNATGSDPDGEIVNWTWHFEDEADPLYGQNVTNDFPSPGSYDATLVATDDLGATTSITKVVDVVNQAPDADFSYDPNPPQVGDTVEFTDESTDVDGTVETRIWDFGDGSPTETGGTASHVYHQSAVYTAQLEAVDDRGKSGFATKDVRVTNDHNVTLDVEVAYPNGQPIDLTDVPVNTSFTVVATGLTAGPGGTKNVTETQDGHSRATFEAGEWAGGEPIRWEVRGPSIPTSSIIIEPPADAFLVERGPVEILIPVEGELEIDAPSSSLLGGAPNTTAYTDPTEPITGNVTLAWATDVPTRNTSLTVTVRYDGHNPDNDAGGALLRYGSVDTDTGVDGRAQWTAPPALDDRAFYLPGWYEVRFHRSFDAQGGSTYTVGVDHVLVDPGRALTTTGLGSALPPVEGSPTETAASILSALT